MRTYDSRVIWTLSASFGVALLFRTVPWLYFYLKLLGGLYITYLGVKFLLSKSESNENNIVPYSGKNGGLRNFRLGLVTNLTNPKTAAFVASIFATTMPRDASCFSVVLISLMMSVISATWYAAVAYVFSLSRFRNIYQNFKIFINRIAGGIFIGFGLKLVADD